MTLTLAPDPEYAVRQAARAQSDLALLVGGRVDLHEPRSPVAERIYLELVDAGETDDPFNAVDAVMQAGCWAPNKRRAATIARTYAAWVQTLRGIRVQFGADPAVHGYQAGTACFALFARWQSTVEHPQSRRDNAGYIVTASFRLSPL